MAMNRYRVFGGVASISLGQVLELAGDQIRSRLHALELPEGYVSKAASRKDKPPEFKPAVVKATQVLAFKRGEIIGLPELPRHLVGIVEPLDPPKNKIDELAADQALKVQNPEAHKRKTAGQKKAAAEAKARAKR